MCRTPGMRRIAASTAARYLPASQGLAMSCSTATKSATKCSPAVPAATRGRACPKTLSSSPMAARSADTDRSIPVAILRGATTMCGVCAAILAGWVAGWVAACRRAAGGACGVCSGSKLAMVWPAAPLTSRAGLGRPPGLPARVSRRGQSNRARVGRVLCLRSSRSGGPRGRARAGSLAKCLLAAVLPVGGPPQRADRGALRPGCWR